MEDVYITPTHQASSAVRMQKHKKTSQVEPRFHLKSTLAEAYVAWKLYRMEHRYNEWMYMSYTAGLGAYHTIRIKRHIRAIPELFGDYDDMTDSASVLHYGIGDREFVCEPEGILTAKRGKHPHGIIADDILRDPEVRLDLTQIQKLGQKFFEVVESMPKEEMHVLGTPQDREDLFFQLEQLPPGLYDTQRRSAEVDPEYKISLWPGLFPWLELMNRKATIGAKAYNKEFLCVPSRTEEAFISIAEMDSITASHLKNYDIYKAPSLKARTIVAGWDLGKKRHPAHFSVLAAKDKGKLLQIHSKFFDGIDYIEQLAYIEAAIGAFNIQKIKADNTRGELTMDEERGDLPREMELETFTGKNKFSMAAGLDRRIQRKGIKLIADQRQRGHFLSIDNDLQGPSTIEGHGDAFFSNLLAVAAYDEASGSPIGTAG